MATKRSSTTSETTEELCSLVTEIRQIASALDDLRARADSFSKPVYDAGWKYPIGSMLGFAQIFRDGLRQLKRWFTERPVRPPDYLRFAARRTRS
jgi:hypothetical protein